MPSGKNSGYRKKPLTRSKRRRSRQKKQRRGPVMRFRFSRLILIWIFSLICCFGAYLLARNLHPEKDVFVKRAEDETETADSAVQDPAAEEPADSQPEQPQDTPDAADPAGENADGNAAEETPAAPAKINPVPESEPMPQNYLAKCAFVGETNIYNLGEDNLLQPFSVYASETLTLENYTKEYVLLNGTTIRILSALNQANCPTYLMFGTESLGKQSVDQTIEHFNQLLDSLIATAPEAKVIVMSIPPVTAEAEKAADHPLLNSVIDEYNSKLLNKCIDKNIYFVDINTALKNNEGKLDGHLATEDGMHLSLEGGMVLLNYVLSHVPQD